MEYYYSTMKSPVGELKLIASDTGLVAVLWENDDPKRIRSLTYTKKTDHPVLIKAQKELEEYFTGKRKKFTVKLDPMGTSFQKNVWTALSEIPYGETRSYAEIAKQVGTPKAVRAVGSANRRNPLCLIVPCHRVVASSGKLAGYAGGLKNKELLLKLESKK